MSLKFDEEQQRIIKDNSKNLFVIAGAGCGKTTLISEKVKYLVNNKINPNKILIISFTNESVNDLIKKIKIENNINVEIKTFHKLGLDIIKGKNNYKIKNNLHNILNKYFLYDIYFTNNYIEYLDYLYTYFYDKKIYKKYKFNNIYEIAINNFLLITNIKYKFELVNFNGILSRFTFILNNIEYKVNICSKNKKSKKNNINLYMNNNILDELIILFKKNKFYNIENNDIEYLSFLNICISFINNYKSIFLNENGFKKLFLNNFKNSRLNLFLNIIYNAYVYYEDYNKKNNIIDFNDMINKSIEIINNTNINYDYIIVDEFQDISFNRLEILKSFSKKGSHITTLGDDFQSIYSFTGSNINLFINFPKLFKDTNILKISKTYRNSQQLIDVAMNFVMKNDLQIKKKLISDKNIQYPIIINFYKNEKLAIFLYNIVLQIYNEDKDKKILLIGRNNFDIYEYIDNDTFKLKDNKVISKLNIDITYLTAHSSKGMTYDEVIIINAKDELYGFPSNVIDNYETSILKSNENFYLAEERRLFYVALTRTKNHTYIISPLKNPSFFVLELLQYKNILTNKKIKNKIYVCKFCGHYNKNKKCIYCKNVLKIKK